ncbi:MAG TPA: glycosyltransferase [Nitrososphaerales archaeon]|nr:glycosyltransferase [Nitrososphaerales archaeon]
MRVLSLSWAPFGHRMDELSRTVGGKRVSITLLYGPRYFAPVRYAALFLRTLIMLATERPDFVYAQNPPVFCPLASLLYCRLAGKRLLVDHHSVWRVKTVGGLVGRGIGFLESFVASAAYLNTTPHEVWARELRKMGARRVLVVHDFVERNPFKRDQRLRDKYAETPTIAIASHGGHPLERLEAEVAATSSLPGVTLLVTGPPSKLAGRLKHLPPNVKFLGMLPMSDYLSLKASVDLALNITDEPHTLSHVIFEYVASSLPVISSPQKVVQDVFGDSILYVDSSDPAEVARKIQELSGDGRLLGEYRSRASEMYERLESLHSSEVDELRNRLK